MTTFISFAEHFEDLILFDALKKEDSIFWIDIGAYDPLDLSVTKAFSLGGGRGINVEPLKHNFEKLVFDRPRDINVEVCVSNFNGEIVLFEAGPASSVEQVTLKRIKKNNALTGERIVQAVTMSSLLQSHLPINQKISFLKIDVEGHEVKVLQGMNFKQCRPLVIIIESVVPWKGTPAFEPWEPILLENDYLFRYEYRNNRYYTARFGSEIEFRGIQRLLSDYRVLITSGPKDKYRLSYMAIEAVFDEYPRLKALVLRGVRFLYPFVSKYFSAMVK